jgi:hypothetical protein
MRPSHQKNRRLTRTFGTTTSRTKVVMVSSFEKSPERMVSGSASDEAKEDKNTYLSDLQHLRLQLHL